MTYIHKIEDDLMENVKQKIAADFDQYQSFLTQGERQAFWVTIEQQANELKPDQRMTAQTGVRENIEQILQRMQTIVAQLTEPEQIMMP